MMIKKLDYLILLNLKNLWPRFDAILINYMWYKFVCTNQTPSENFVDVEREIDFDGGGSSSCFWLQMINTNRWWPGLLLYTT